MAGRDKELQKKLIRDSIIVVVVLIAMSGIAMLVSSYYDDTQTEKQQKENENTATRSEVESIRQQLGSGTEVITNYGIYTKNHNHDFTLDRENATASLTGLRDKHHLINLSVTISPITDLTGIALKSGTLVKSEVKLSFGALTDNSVYGFIEALQREWPGVILISQLNMSKTADLSRSTLVDLSQHKISPLVTADMTFFWLGIRPKSEDKTPGASSALKGPANGR